MDGWMFGWLKHTWVPERDGARDVLCGVGWQQLGGVVDELSALAVACENDFGVGALGERLLSELGPVYYFCQLFCCFLL
jgi:hypothetical protein